MIVMTLHDDDYYYIYYTIINYYYYECTDCINETAKTTQHCRT